MFQSINPVSQEILKTFESLDESGIQKKLAVSAEVFNTWKNVSLAERIEVVKKISLSLLIKKDEYASIMVREMGKLKSEAEAEIGKCALLCDYYAKNAADFLAERTIETEYSKSYVTYQPLGSILGIMPWNFPFWQSFRFAVPALLSGNTILLKPAPNVPESGMALEEIFTKAIGKPGVFQTLLAEVTDIPKIINHPAVGGVSLTGSNKAGSTVAAQAGAAIKKCLLELGGSDPFIVLEDANIQAAVDLGFASRMLNCGQTCIAAKRFILQKNIAETFIQGLKHKIEQLIIGDPLNGETTLSPMARPDLSKQLQQQVDDSIKMGATVLHPGGLDEKHPNYFHPLILGDIKPEMPAYQEELFGPVFSIFIVDTVKEAIELANDTAYGLGASVWSENSRLAEEVALQLNAGAVAINDMVKSDPRLPFGGVNQSGFGRELAIEGLREFVNIKSVVVR
jgi:succinate-semialdehyde dehydrogenase/glutarate-semialdehyde dehydrogenase